MSLIRVELISAIFRAKFRDLLKRAGLFELVSPRVWSKDWVVHCKPVGTGHQALLYLARYLFRVAIANSRIVAVDDEQVVFRCQDSASGKWQLRKLPSLSFIHRFLQHMLPKGFQKVRYYGLLSPGKKHLCAEARYILRVDTARKKARRPASPNPAAPNAAAPCTCLAKSPRPHVGRPRQSLRAGRRLLDAHRSGSAPPRRRKPSLAASLPRYCQNHAVQKKTRETSGNKWSATCQKSIRLGTRRFKCRCFR